MSHQQWARTEFTYTFLKTCSLEKAHAASGLKHPSTHLRIAEHLEAYGTLAEAPHHRQPAKFTNEVMAMAQELLLESEAQLRTADLLGMLVQQGMLPQDTDQHNFLAHLKAWMAEQGLTLVVGDTSTIFCITETTATERLQFVTQHEPELRSSLPLDKMVVCDETTFEESSHPKGALFEAQPLPPLPHANAIL